MIIMKRGRPQLPPEEKKVILSFRFTSSNLPKLDYLIRKEKAKKTEIIRTALLNYIYIKELIKMLKERGLIKDYEIKTFLLMKGCSEKDVEKILSDE